ncbi:rod shape-determining protein MreC [Candidatus Pelagibacter sp.]|nr:rod shape-determining protein MreC [Candidatus Pelagibacter bacterium]MDC0364247.1 rod shape-determining protein MreC [Candidatus Pelagibacter sp.]
MEQSRDDFVIAIRSAFLKKGTQQRFSLLGLIFFSIIFLILGSYNFKVVDLVKISIKEVVYRSSFIVSGPEKIIGIGFNKITDHINHYSNYKNMEEKLDKLEALDLSNQIITLENIKYKKLVDDYFIKNNEIFAKVLIDKNSPFLRSVVLNKGSKNNIKLGMAVLDGEYLIGKVVEVNFFTSRVLLISDINSKIPVSISPNDVQAIMSGDGKQNATLQYIQGTDLKNNNEDMTVTTSGAGGLFKSGILIGKINFTENSITNNLKVNIYKDFSQLKYVKVISFSKEEKALDQTSKDELETMDAQILEATKQKENIRILLEEKKIASEVRKNIEIENSQLKRKIFNLQTKLTKTEEAVEEQKKQKENIEFLELNLLYGHKCRKTMFNKLHKVGTPEYKNCVLQKGKM